MSEEMERRDRSGASLVSERRETIEKRLWDMFSKVPPEVSLVDELIDERRVEARRAAGE